MRINTIKMLKEKDLAEMLNCSQRTIKRYTEKQKLIAVDFCNSVRYPGEVYADIEIVEKEYLTISEASRYLNICRQKLNEMLDGVYEGDTFFHCKQKVNNKTKINTRQLLAYINQNIIN